MKNNYIVTAIVAIIVGIGAFFAGSHFAASQTPQGGGAGQTGQFSRSGAAAGRAFNGTAGTIVSVTGNTMTIQMSGGSSKIVFFDPSVQVTKTVPGTMSDLSAGTAVLVTGTANSDGSLTAQSIQIRPAGARGQNPSSQGGSGTVQVQTQ